MRKRKYCQYVVSACVFVCLYYFFNVGDYIHTKDYEHEFDYPLNIDLKPVVKEVLSGRKPKVSPINYYPYRFLSNSGKCSTLEKLDLFIVVKSAMSNFEQRIGIRKTYGQENLMPGFIIRILFFLGIDDAPKSETQRRIDREMAEYKDIIQIDFHDSYYNNTIKTMMSFRWLYEHCATADYYLFTDDDIYISVSNLLEYVHDEAPANKVVMSDRDGNAIDRGDEEDGILFAGYVFKSAPQRFRSSKWRVSLDEYPWNKWPPYVTAGAYVVSNRCMRMLYAGSLFVKNFRFDDIYLGIVAKKVGIEPTHCPKFHFYKKSYSKGAYKDVIASHGYGDPNELIKVWTEQNMM